MSDTIPSTVPDQEEDFFENPVSGHLILDPARGITRANGTIARWLGSTPRELLGRPLSDFLTVGGRMFSETHLFPLLRMQGWFGEVSLELRDASGGKTAILMNGSERRDPDGNVRSIHLCLYRAAERLAYEGNLRESRNNARQALLDEQQTSLLREEFIAVLGHDLRNPLGAILMSSHLLSENGDSAARGMLVDLVRQSAERMQRLIDDVMDFARGRLGGGMVIDRRMVSLEKVLVQIVEELRLAHPGREIHLDFSLPPEVSCDPVRISQLLSNLLANAMVHGSPDQPVRVRGSVADESLELGVHNSGTPIPAELLPKLFQPFTRQKVRPSQNGLGLGLFIASEIARGHGGTLEVSSQPEETSFVFRMPLGRTAG